MDDRVSHFLEGILLPYADEEDKDNLLSLWEEENFIFKTSWSDERNNIDRLINLSLH